MSITEKWARQRESVWHLGGQNTHEISPEIKTTRGSNFLTGGRLRNFFLRNQPIFWEILEINRSDELELTGLIGYRHECFFGSQRLRAHYKGSLIQNSLIVVESVCQQFPSPSDPKLSRNDFQRVRSNIAKMNPYSLRLIWSSSFAHNFNKLRKLVTRFSF